MRISAILTPMSDHHLRLAKQVGASDVVTLYPGLDLQELLAVRDRVESFGLKLSVIERLIPHDKIVHGKSGRDEQIEGFRQLIRNAGTAGIETICYNWMPGDDWTRTAIDLEERGGALVTGFDIDALPKKPETGRITSESDLWANLDYFLQQVVPVAEEHGVNLALHPDDPPMTPLHGQPQIIISAEAMERAAQLAPSPANGLCFCQGTLASAGEDIPTSIHRLAPYLKFAHFRDVVGTVPKFRESFQDNGQTDMAAAMRAYKEIGFQGTIRPDHAPTLAGEPNDHPGYEMLGRLYAIGYMRGLMHAT